MAEFAWAPASPLSGVLKPGRHGQSAGPSGLRLEERGNLSLVQVMARRGGFPAASAAAERLFGVAPPSRPAAAFAAEVALVWSGPGQFLIVGSGDGMADPLAAYAPAFGGSASLSDQSDGRTRLRLAGGRARAALAKVSSLDFDPSAFPVGAAAATSMDHTHVSLWRAPDEADGAPVFELLVFRSFAESLWHALETAALEYGVDVASV